MYETKLLSKKDIKFLKLAQNIAKDSLMPKKHCAIIIKGKSIVSIGINSKRTHPEMFSRDKDRIFLHAEVDAIMSSQYKNIKGSTMYVSRHSIAGKHISKPCDICMDVIKKSGIKKILYTTDTGYEVERINNNGSSHILYKQYFI